MSRLKKGFCLAVALLFLVVIGAEKAEAGAFANLKLKADLTTDAAAANDAKVNDGTIEALPPVTGAQVEIEFFVESVPAGTNTIGYNIEFDNTGNVFTDNFTIDSIAGLVSSLGVTATVATGGTLPPGATVSANGYIATVTLTAKQDVPDGTVISFVGGAGKTTVGDAATFDNDPLDVAGLTLTFQQPPQPTLSAASALATIPRGGTVSVDVTMSNIAVGDQIDWTVTVTGAATVEVSGQTGLTFSTTATATTETITLVGSQAGDATADVGADVNTTAVTPVQIVFSEQVPVELSAFGGALVEGRVELNWTTVSQTNNAGWRVLRSTDNETFEVASDLVSGAGTTDVLLNYSFTDQQLPASEQVFYVLEQIDLDGTVHRSNPVEVILGVRFLLPTEFATSIYPNPFNPSTTISYDLPNEAAVSIVIYDALGQEIRQLVSESRAPGRYSIQWDAKDRLGHSVGSGVYIAKIKAGSFTASQKMLLLK